jgi:drug/metabolite transporter (DMT)-like permease
VTVSVLPAQSNLKAALWMAGWLAAMLLLLVAGRASAREVNVFQLMLLRSTIGILLLYPLIYRQGGFSTLRSARPLQQLGRNAVHYVAQYLWFLALTMIPIAQVVSIEFTMPIWTAILAALFLGERITGWKAVAIILGLIGVLVIVRPNFGAVNTGQLIMVASAMGFAISIVLVKSLTRTDSVVTIIFWMLLIQSAIGVIPAAYVWVWPSAYVWGWLVVVAFCGTYSHYCMTQAMRHADATVVIPMDFLRVPLSAAVGWLVYNESLDIFTAAGVVLILFGNLLNLRRSPATAKSAQASA